MRLLMILLAAVSPMWANAFCFEEASQRYDVPVHLLKVIAEVESGMKEGAVNTNADGSQDIGIMQINTAWLPTLKRYGIERSDLWNPCINVQVGAWILSKNIATYGYTWEAVGAYNARSAEKRERYAKRVFRQVRKRGGNG